LGILGGSPKPASHPPEPASHSPEPASRPPEPASRPPEPASHPPEPASYPPEPASHPPEPASHPPEPASHSPEPASHSPEPASHPPEPASHSPEPASHPPEPASHPPEPASHPPEPASHPPEPASHPPEPASHPPEPASHPPEPASHPPGIFRPEKPIRRAYGESYFGIVTISSLGPSYRGESRLPGHCLQGVPVHFRPQRGGGDSLEAASHAHPESRLRRVDAHQEQAAFTLTLDVEYIPRSCRRKDHSPLGIRCRYCHDGIVSLWPGKFNARVEAWRDVGHLCNRDLDSALTELRARAPYSISADSRGTYLRPLPLRLCMLNLPAEAYRFALQASLAPDTVTECRRKLTASALQAFTSRPEMPAHVRSPFVPYCQVLSSALLD